MNIASGSVSQTIATTSGAVYLVDFWLNGNGDYSGGTLTVSFGSTTGFSEYYAPGTGPGLYDGSYGPGQLGPYQEYSFTAVATGTATTFDFSAVMSGGTFFLDDVSITEIQSPTNTWNLIANGSFEAPAIPSNTLQEGVTPDDWTPLPGNTFMFNMSIAGGFWPQAEDGQQYFDVGDGGIFQSATNFIPGQYQLTWYQNAALGWGPAWCSVTVSNSSLETVASNTVSVIGTALWQEQTILLNLSADTYTLSFSGIGVWSGADALIDNVSLVQLYELPDLAVGGFIAPPTAVIAQPVQLVFTITNAGNAEAVGPWSNQVLLAPNTSGSGAQSVGSFTFTNNLLAGAATTITQTVILPPSITGTQYFGVLVDSGDVVPELNRTNNTSFAANAIVIAAPDLVLWPLGAPATAQFGQPFTVQFAVTNAGGVAATAAWNDQLYFGSFSNTVAGATVLATVAGTSPLAPGNGYTRTQTVTIPLTTSSAPGTFYITAVADSGNALFESSKANSLLTVPITLTLPPLPDLTVGQVFSPTSAVAGQAVSVSWVVTNMGAATAVGPLQEAVYLVPASLALTDFSTNPAAYPLIGAFTYTNSLAPGGSIDRTQLVTIPSTGSAGDERVAVVVDSQNSVVEQSESNNAALALNDLQVPVMLSLTVPVTNVVQNTATPTFTCLVSRDDDLSATIVVSLVSTATNKLLVPASVTIPSGVATVPFTATVLDDGVPGPNVSVTLSANAGGYLGATSQVLVVNTDVPSLALSMALPQITEGQTVTATVSSKTVSAQAVVVTIASSSPAALAVPGSVTIPANSNSVAFTLLAVQNTIIAPAQTYTVSASAGGYAGASAVLTVLNDNAPTLTLSLDRTNINEADGPFAAVATVARQPVTDQPVTLALTSTNPGAARVPEQVTIPALQGNATFYIAAVNDTNVTGPKVTLGRVNK